MTRLRQIGLTTVPLLQDNLDVTVFKSEIYANEALEMNNARIYFTNYCITKVMLFLIFNPFSGVEGRICPPPSSSLFHFPAYLQSLHCRATFVEQTLGSVTMAFELKANIVMFYQMLLEVKVFINSNVFSITILE